MHRRLPFFYGWVNVAAVFICLLVTAGLGFYNASVILAAAKEELGVSVGAVSVGPTLFFGISGFTGFFLSKQMDRLDLRYFYLAGGIIGAAALWGLRFVSAVWSYYVFFALFGIGFALAGLVPSTTLVARWFAARRSVALSISSTGLSVGGIVLTPVAASMIDAQGLAGASTEMALLWFVVVVPVSWIFIRSTPAQLGLQPDNAPTPATPRALEGATFLQARSSRFFKSLSITYAMIFLAQVGGIAHLFNLTSERVDSNAAATVVRALAFSSVAGRLAGGLIVLKLPAKSLTLFLTLVQAVALAFIAFADTKATILAGSCLFGLSVGNLLMLQPLLIAEAFGVKEYSQIYSLNQLAGTVGVAGGPFLLGAIHDLSNYETALIVGAVCNLVGLVALVSAGSTSEARKIWQ